ncbi:Uncharacterized protein Adt_10549 [Abeliophyllum distichum]|uniref:RNase H type-1 domain-containing protein n=1 Tax=Abeliophyllum distichum TaxID=126358 RepID=A0ABD1UKA8_9LAMI
MVMRIFVCFSVERQIVREQINHIRSQLEVIVFIRRIDYAGPISTISAIIYSPIRISHSLTSTGRAIGTRLFLTSAALKLTVPLILAQRLGLSVQWVESDSTLAIHCITKGGGPWHIQATLRHIRHLLALDRDTITHIFREGNQVADLLASEGWD